jgi:hypothetical protein
VSDDPLVRLLKTIAQDEGVTMELCITDDPDVGDYLFLDARTLCIPVDTAQVRALVIDINLEVRV